MAKASPRARLVQIIKVIEAVCVVSGNRASIPELAHAFTRCFNPDMMLYLGFGSGLAEAIDGNPFDQHGGYNERASIACEIFNSGYWKESQYRHPVMFGYADPLDVDDVLISKFDGERLAHKLWDHFFNHPDDVETPIEFFPKDEYLAHISSTHPRCAPEMAELSPSSPEPRDTIKPRTANASGDTKQSETPLSTRERNTLLTIIAVLCKDSGYDTTKHAKTAGLIQSTAATMGLSIGESTIEGHLKKIPDALATRMK